MIYILETKNGKAELRGIDHTQVQQVLMNTKDLAGEKKRRWTLTMKNGSIYDLPDDAVYLPTRSSPEFNALLEEMAKILKV